MNGRLETLPVVLCTAALFSGCIVRSGEVEISNVVPAQREVRSPVKAHLIDGHVVTFPRGVTFDRRARRVRGDGERWDLLLQRVGSVSDIPLDSVAGMETYRSGINEVATVALTLPAIALGVVGASGLAVAIFGSCPTFYVDEGGDAALQAEGFSYSIAPLLESRDVDRLNVQPDSQGLVRIEVRNEALETHFLNHVELLELRHGPGRIVLPDYQQRPIAVGELQQPTVATDRAGRPLLPLIAGADNSVFETDPITLGQAEAGDLHDHIDLTFPVPIGSDSAALVLRLRNSLLTTVLLYDVLLRGRGPAALDWLGQELDHVGNALELGRWYGRQMGLHVQVWTDGEYRTFTRISETGPIAWKELAVVVPVEPGADSVRLRLRFLADNWRFDRLAIATDFERPQAIVHPVYQVELPDGSPQPEVVRAITNPDEEYLTTTPGQRYFIEFATESSVGVRTFLLASQGYYTEWMRRDWLAGPSPEGGLHPSDDLLVEALERWRTRKAGFEEEFYASKISVR